MAVLGDFRPNVIIHTAGSNRSADMETVITAGTRHVVEAAAAVSARLIFLSTDVVLTEQRDPMQNRPNRPPFTLTDAPNNRPKQSRRHTPITSSFAHR